MVMVNVCQIDERKSKGNHWDHSYWFPINIGVSVFALNTLCNIPLLHDENILNSIFF